MASPSIPNFSFPDRDELRACGPWCAPLHMVERVVAALPDGRYFDVDHFMIMGKVLRRDRPHIILYKHVFTRHYLNLDEAGHSYRYHAPRSDSGNGQYRRDRDLAAAIRRVGLHDVPYLSGSTFLDERDLTSAPADRTAPPR